MRILCLAPFSSIDELHGGSVRLIEVTCNLALRNEVVVVARSGKHWRQPTTCRIRFIRSRRWPVLDRYLASSIALWKAYQWAVRLKPDVIYETAEGLGVAWALRALLGIPLVTEYNGLEEDERKSQGLRAMGVVERALYKRTFDAADSVIAVTPGLKATLQEASSAGEKRWAVIGNGADTSGIQPMTAVTCRNELGLDSAGVYVVFLGGLFPWQGVDVLLEALAEASTSEGQLRLLVVGDGPEKARLMARSRELGVNHVTVFAGAVPHAKVPAYLGASDFCAAPFPSARNARIGLSPLKLFEYMAAGRAILTTSIPGVKEVVEESGCGVVVPPDDSHRLASALVYLSRNPRVTREMGERGRISVGRFSWNVISEQVEAVLADASHGRPVQTAVGAIHGG